MSCAVCASDNQTEFTAEINIHFRGRKNVDHPGILVFPKVLVCLDCGWSGFTTPKAELSQLARGAASGQALMSNGSVEDAVFRRRIALGA
jgi:hypothetical protein